MNSDSLIVQELGTWDDWKNWGSVFMTGLELEFGGVAGSSATQWSCRLEEAPCYSYALCMGLFIVQKAVGSIDLVSRIETF